MAVDSPPGWPDDAVEVGRIVEAWGLKGWVRVQPYATPAAALLAARRWFLRPSDKFPAPAIAGAHWPAMLDIAEVREHGDGLVASSRQIADRSAAEALRNARIFVARTHFPKAAVDEFYWADLIGLAVVNRDGVRLGIVAGLIDTGPQSVLRVAGSEPGSDERLIPFVAAYVDSVDLASRTIVVDWQLDF